MKTTRFTYSLLFILIFVLSNQSILYGQTVVETADKTGFMSVLGELNSNSFKTKSKVVEKIAEFDLPQVNIVLDALLNNRLYQLKKNKRLFIVQKLDKDYQLIDILTSKELNIVAKKEIRKIRTNNKLRKQIRNIIALTKLKNPDDTIRLNALHEIIKSIKPSHLSLLEKTIKNENNPLIRDTLQTAINIIHLNTSKGEKKIQIIKQLGESLNPKAKEKLLLLVKKNEQGEYIEQNTEITSTVEQSLKNIGYKQSFYSKVETLFFGLSLGSVLLLSAIGLAITFGVMGVINMAHGELMMLGAYTTYLVQQLMPAHIDLSLLVALPAAFIVSGLFGIAIERGVIRHLYGRPLETLLATFGISLLLQQLVRTAISAQNVAVETPSWLSGSLVINPIFSITYNRLYILFFALFLFVLLLLLLKKTTLGLQVRAVAQNRGMAKAMGIKTEWIDSLTFGLGAGIAGIAGVALSQLTNVGPNLGQAYIIDSFMVVVFGGVESLWGTLVAAMTLGVANKFLEPWVGAVMAKIIVLIFLILFIQKKPKGLFPQKGRSTVGS